MSASVSASRRTSDQLRHRATFAKCNRTFSPDGRPNESPLCQLELDAAIATVGVLRRATIDRLEFAEPGSHEPRWFHAFANQVLHHGDRPFRRQIPIRFELSDDRPHIGMAVNAQYPGNFSRN